MKRTTNFVAPIRTPVYSVTLVVWLAAIGAAVGCGWLINEVSRLNENSQKFARHIGDLDQSLASLRENDAEIPTTAAVAELNQTIEFLNSLTGDRHLPLPLLLAELETLVPATVWVSQLSYHLDSGRFSISLQAEQETQLTPALSGFETANFLRDVILDRQLRVQRGAQALVQYDIEATVK